jgi:hypothetical protein
VRVPPLPVGAQPLLQRVEAGEVVQEGHRGRLRRGSVVGQPGQQVGVVGRAAGEPDRGVEAVDPPSARRGQDRSLHGVEPVVAGQEALVVQHRRQVGIEQQEAPHLCRRGHEGDRRTGDDSDLPEPGAQRVEQVRVAGR